MAAAYAYHLSQNHPFYDGNKRTALACAVAFLDMNGVPIADPEGQLYETMMSVVLGKLDKLGLAAVMRSLEQDQRS